MTRFLTQQVVPMGGKRVTVMTRPANDLNALAGRAPEVLAEARTLLRRTIAQLDGRLHERVVKAAHRYFLTDALSIAKQDVAEIRRVLVLVSSGLSGDVTIKVGDHVGANDKSVNGAVSNSSNLTLTKPYHNLAANLETGAMRKRRAIRMRDARFLSDLGAKTLIHEATHKYAGTIDYCYFKDDGVTPKSTFNDKTKAMINADSYAWFAYTAGGDWM